MERLTESELEESVNSALKALPNKIFSTLPNPFETVFSHKLKEALDFIMIRVLTEYGFDLSKADTKLKRKVQVLMPVFKEVNKVGFYVTKDRSTE